MLEVLIAVIVFAFGAIGATAMQVMGALTNHEAMQRTQAVYLATDLIERLRNNPGALDSYDASADAQWTLLGGASIANQPTPQCDAAACTEQQKAAYDLWLWEQALDGNEITQTNNSAVGGLQAPTGCIRHTGGGRVELAIAWHGRRGLSNSSIAPGCTVAGRYGGNDEYRRVLFFNTFIAP